MIPPELVDAAADAMASADPVRRTAAHHRMYAAAALEAAAPLIAKAERDRIRQIAVKRSATYSALTEVPGIGGQEWRSRPFADLIGDAS